MNRIVIIGATSAIAIECARLWAADAGQFLLAGRNQDQLSALAADLKIRGAASVETFTMDANDRSKDAGLREAISNALQTIDIALIAHGTLPDQERVTRDVNEAVQHFTTNATSAIAMMTMLAQIFEHQKGGTLAVISSVAGDRGRPSNYLYGAAKGAVSIFADGLRARLFPLGIQVLTIKPGFVATPMTAHLKLPAALVAEPQVIAKSIVKAITRKRDVIYSPGFWWLIMSIIKSIPRPIFKRLKL